MIAGLRKVAALAGVVLVTLALPAQALSPFTADDVFQLAWTSSPLVDRKGERVLYLRHSMDIMRDQPRSNLWQVNMDGREHRPVTTGPDSISSPALAPDGKRVAYVRRDDTGPQLFISWLDSAQTAQLTRVPYPPANLAWSPDGKWLAFRMLVPGEAPTIGTLPRAPAGAQWADAPEVVERMIYRADGAGGKPHGYEHIFVIPADGGSPRQVTTDDFHHSGSIAWSADSAALYISANRNPD